MFIKFKTCIHQRATRQLDVVRSSGADAQYSRWPGGSAVSGGPKALSRGPEL